MDFALDPRLLASSLHAADLPLCEARLQDDARYPWIVLTPRRPGLVEITDLSPSDREQLWSEVMSAGGAVQAVGRALGRPGLKLNHGQLGNVVAQLHIHVVGRHPADAAWPGPVWGVGEAIPYGRAERDAALGAARAVLIS
jgi:diadenosine tetraphosphate (Ap4A) HIT family hydrolase